MESIASKLARLRAELGLSTRKFAAAVSEAGYPIAHSTVGSYEREEGTDKIPAGYLAAVCLAFGKSANWLLLEVGPPDLGVAEAGDPYRRGRSDVAAAVVELLIPDLMPGDGVKEGDESWRGALETLRRYRGDLAEEEEGAG